jgi:hypothetical protein
MRQAGSMRDMAVTDEACATLLARLAEAAHEPDPFIAVSGNAS